MARAPATPGMTARAAGMILAGCLLLGFVACLALVTSSADTLGLTSWVTISAIAGVLVVVGTAILCMTTSSPGPRPAVCPINTELWRIIDEETRPRHR